MVVEPPVLLQIVRPFPLMAILGVVACQEDIDLLPLGDTGADMDATAQTDASDIGFSGDSGRPSGDGAIDDSGSALPDPSDGGDGGTLTDGGDTNDGGENRDGGIEPPIDGGPLPTDVYCGGFIGQPCPDPAGSFCDFRANSCGLTDKSGMCASRPSLCDDVYEPVCACDGKIHSNECDAYAEGVDVSLGGCPSLAGYVRCGYRFCDPDRTYCRQNVPGTITTPSTFECQPLPSSCNSNITCGCLAAEPCGDTCQELSSGGIMVTCSFP